MASVYLDPHWQTAESPDDVLEGTLKESFARSRRPWSAATRSGVAVPFDMHETEETLIIRADLPRVKPQDLEIDVTKDTVRIKGQIPVPAGERGRVHIEERAYGEFRRVIPLPISIDRDAAQAELENGVLTITLPQKEGGQGKRIQVKTKS